MFVYILHCSLESTTNVETVDCFPGISFNYDDIENKYVRPNVGCFK